MAAEEIAFAETAAFCGRCGIGLLDSGPLCERCIVAMRVPSAHEDASQRDAVQRAIERCAVAAMEKLYMMGYTLRFAEHFANIVRKRGANAK